MNLPEVTLDEEGYPTEEFLLWIRNYNLSGNVHDLIATIKDNWNHGSWGFIKKRPRNGKYTLELHTGGWSGNEEIIEALRGTVLFLLYWRKTEVGGHYYFKIPR